MSQDIKTRIDRISVKIDGLRDEILGKTGELTDTEYKAVAAEEHIAGCTQATQYINAAVESVMSEFTTEVESLVTSAIQTIYDRDISFKLEFKQRGGRPEVVPTIIENGEAYYPKGEAGGGMMDIISFALRVVLMSIKRPETRKVIILDEPFRFVGKGEMLDKVGSLLAQLSAQLGIQFIIITHEPELARIANKAWEVTHNGETSQIAQLSEEDIDM